MYIIAGLVVLVAELWLTSLGPTMTDLLVELQVVAATSVGMAMFLALLLWLMRPPTDEERTAERTAAQRAALARRTALFIGEFEARATWREIQYEMRPDVPVATYWLRNRRWDTLWACEPLDAGSDDHITLWLAHTAVSRMSRERYTYIVGPPAFSQHGRHVYVNVPVICTPRQWR